MVSVIIPTYNRADKIKAAIESVLNQTYSDLEVIVIDDGSTDNTKEVIDTVDDSRLKYVYQNNSGACVARNHGIDLAMGKYIAFHDSDDLWKPKKLEKQIKALVDNDADIVFCRLVNHYATNKTSLKPEYGVEGFWSPVKNLFGIGTQTLLAKNHVFKEFRFDKDFPRFQEFEMLYRATKKYSIYCVDAGLVDYYVGDDSISNNPEKLYKACILLLEKHPELAYEHFEMSNRIAQNLYAGAITERKKGIRYSEKYLKLSKKCKKSTKLKVKYYLIKFGFYK